MNKIVVTLGEPAGIGPDLGVLLAQKKLSKDIIFIADPLLIHQSADKLNKKVDLNIEQLNYHLYNIRNFNGSIRTTSNHFIYIDTLSLEAAGGQIKMSGYFNGSNPKLIYFSPKMNLYNVDLDELLLKFCKRGLVFKNGEIVFDSNIQEAIKKYHELHI